MKVTVGHHRFEPRHVGYAYSDHCNPLSSISTNTLLLSTYP